MTPKASDADRSGNGRKGKAIVRDATAVISVSLRGYFQGTRNHQLYPSQ